MKEGDVETHYSYYALHKLRILPHELMALKPPERAAVYAMIDIRVEEEKRAAKARNTK
ncbi:conserved protein of unknown function [Paenibacillus alvei]|uniref:Uncharacterized protein n=1 Tax=Paenibacillus alvei TaxID=44250 RepID=A0A383REC4_PAEAL|nr:conserved protein of unknown function [Paenibacillus alvei]